MNNWLRAGTATLRVVQSGIVALIDRAQTITGLFTFDRGTAAPFAVTNTSAAVVTNLDADKLDGSHAAAFSAAFTNSAALAGLLSDKTGTGAAVFADAPSFSGYVDFAEIAEPADPGAGVLRLWAEDAGGFGQLHFSNSNGLNYQLARDNIHTVRNSTGSTLSKGALVYISGSTGVYPSVALAQANSPTTAPVAGLVVADITNNSFGQMMTMGDIEGIDTSAFSDGDVLYLSAATAGAATTTKPTGTDLQQRVGVVVKGGSVGGGIIAILIGADFDPADTTTFSNKTLVSPTLSGVSSLANGVLNADAEQMRLVRADNATIRYHSIHTQHTAAANTNYVQVRVHDASTTTAETVVVTLTGDGRVGVGGVTAPVGVVDADQPSTTAAIPVLRLDQADESEGFIDYIGTSAASAAGPVSTWTVATLAGYVRCEINGASYWMPFYNAPTA